MGKTFEVEIIIFDNNNAQIKGQNKPEWFELIISQMDQKLNIMMFKAL